MTGLVRAEQTSDSERSRLWIFAVHGTVSTTQATERWMERSLTDGAVPSESNTERAGAVDRNFARVCVTGAAVGQSR